MTFLPGFLGGAAGSIIFNTSAIALPAGGAPFTFAAQSIGVASPDRLVAVALMYGAVGAIGSVTIGGIAATKVIGAANGTAFAEIWVAVVPAGTTANIDLGSGSGTFPRLCISVYSIYGIANQTPLSTGTDITSPYSVGLSSAAGCVAIGAFINNTNTLGVTWTGLTEDVDGLNPGAVLNAWSYSSASLQAINDPVTATVTPNTLSNAALVAALWSP